MAGRDAKGAEKRLKRILTADARGRTRTIELKGQRRKVKGKDLPRRAQRPQRKD